MIVLRCQQQKDFRTVQGCRTVKIVRGQQHMKDNIFFLLEVGQPQALISNPQILGSASPFAPLVPPSLQCATPNCNQRVYQEFFIYEKYSHNFSFLFLMFMRFPVDNSLCLYWFLDEEQSSLDLVSCHCYCYIFNSQSLMHVQQQNECFLHF